MIVNNPLTDSAEIEQEDQPRETILQHHESIASGFFEK